MKNTIAKRGRRIALVAFAAPFLLVGIYLWAALIGALIPAQNASYKFNATTVTTNDNADIFLVSTLLHVDIAIPVTPEIKSKFRFLQQDGFPLSNQKLAYLVIGWGSREFYTQTKDYVDIRFATALRAITGDQSVMHIIPSADLAHRPQFKKISLSHTAIEIMADEILTSFQQSADGVPILLPDKNHGAGDLFYEAKGSFNVFKPCNVWAAKMLRSAGVKTGIWTPTTYSLMLSLDLH